MQGGDITNETGPRIYVIFEDLVGLLTGKDRIKHFRDVRRRDWAKAASRWLVNQPVIDALWALHHDLVLVTYLPAEEAEALGDLVHGGSWPFCEYENLTIREMALRAINPGTLAVIDGDPGRWLTYGRKGYVIPSYDPRQLVGLEL